MSKWMLVVGAAVLLGFACGCSGPRSHESDYDTRTLERRPLVETVRPVDRLDPFRP